jgi:hypothetical protein
MDAREFSEWQAFYMLEPWGSERSDLQAGIVASVIANVNRSKHARSYTPHDFMPKFTRTARRQSNLEIQNVFKVMSASVNAGKRQATA